MIPYEKLSPRLKWAFQFRQDCDHLFDVACDHGHLGLLTLSSSTPSRVSFVDPAKMAIDKLKQEIGEQSTTSFYNKKFEDLSPLELTGDFYVMAGIGEWKIIYWLDHLKKTQKSPYRVAIIPQTEQGHLDNYLAREKWHVLKKESICDGRYERIGRLLRP